MIFGWRDRVGVSGQCRRRGAGVAAGMVAAGAEVDATMVRQGSVEGSEMPF